MTTVLDNRSGKELLRIAEVAIDDAQGIADIVDLHMELLNFGPMAGLGARFIRDVGYKLHMADDLLRVAICRIDNKPAGFVAYTARSLDFHRSSLARHWLKVCWVLFLSLIERPRRISSLARALRTVSSRRKEKHRKVSGTGEIVAIAVRREYLGNDFRDDQGRSVSELLVTYGQQRLGELGISEMRMLVDAHNKGALMLYHRLGARMEAYEQGGEPMVEVWLETRRIGEARDVPACWLESVNTDGQANDWDEYWERLDSSLPVFRFEALDFVSRLNKVVADTERMRVLDFGCGFGFVSERLAPQVKELAIWDSAANMRHGVYSRLSGIDNIRFLDLSRPEQDKTAGEFDLILVNSVIQYMSLEQLNTWLERWKSLLKPDGKLIISDIIEPDYSFLRDVAAILRFSLRHGFLFRAVRDGLKEIRSYKSVKASKPLMRMSAEAVTTAAAGAGLDVASFPANLTYHAGRLTAILRKS